MQTVSWIQKPANAVQTKPMNTAGFWQISPFLRARIESHHRVNKTGTPADAGVPVLYMGKLGQRLVNGIKYL